MGSRLTRATLHSRQPIPSSPQNQQYIMTFIKVMATGLQIMLVFGIGVLDVHPPYGYLTTLFYSIIGIICSLLLNASNPQAMILFGWILLTIQSITGSNKILFIYKIGSFSVVYGILTNFFNYYTKENGKKYIQHIVPTVLTLFVAKILDFSHIFSHFLHKMHSSSQKMTYTSIVIEVYGKYNHQIGIRLLFSLLGVLIAFLSISAHSYVKRMKFHPISAFYQIIILKRSWNNWKMFKIFIIAFSLRSVFFYYNPKPETTHCLFSIAISLCCSLAISKFSSNLKEKYSSLIVTIGSLMLFIANYIINSIISKESIFCTFFTEMTKIVLIIFLCSQIAKTQKINYILAFVTVIILYKTQKINEVNIQNSKIIGFIGLTILSIKYFKYFMTSTKPTHNLNHTESLDTMENNNFYRDGLVNGNTNSH